MNKLRLLGAVCACVFSFILVSTAQAAPISGQGTWETTLEGRDLDGNAATFEAYYDTTLNISWLVDANYAFTTSYAGADSLGRMNWGAANTWAAGLDINGVTGWRLPTVTPINGSTFNTSFTTNATSDVGYAPTTSNGTDGGWRNGSGTPVSEMGHMFYVNLGNLGVCPSDGGDGDPATCDGHGQAGWGLSNSGPFSNIQIDNYWFGTETDSSNAFNMTFFEGNQGINAKSGGGDRFAWAVHAGDVGAVPIPAAVWLFGSGLIGLIGIARRKRA